MIHIYHGNGKGKTTCAVGLSIRAVGAGLNVLFTQFMKGNSSSEISVLNQISGIQVDKIQHQYGFSWTMTDDEKKSITQEHNQLLTNILTKLTTEKVDMLILDEVISAYNLNFLDKTLLFKVLDYSKTNNVEIVLTGREPAKELLEKADYITNMTLERHPYEKNIQARKGVEF